MAVIGIDTVIAVAARSLTASLRHTTFSLELTNGRWRTPQSVSRENVRWWVVGVRQCFLQEQLGRLAVTLLGEVEVIVWPWLSTARNRYIHLPAIRTNVSSKCQVDDLRLTSPWSRRWTSGPYAWIHRHMEV